ncbi:MAG: ABC transporter substrate-binding protein [Acetobacteraceae bacterium]
MKTTTRGVSRRHALKLGAAAGALPLVHIRTAGAAGTVKLGFWDHWVPGGNGVMKKQAEAWAAKNHVTVECDFISSNGGKLQLTGVAESRARAGHDMYTFYSWDVYNIHQYLEPMDDVMKTLIAKNGTPDVAAEYLANVKGHWLAVPSSSGSQTKPPCGRISWLKAHGFDPTAVYPVKPEATKMAAEWNYDLFMKLAATAQKEGKTFSLGCGSPLNTDATDMWGALFHAFGANLVDKNNKILLDSPEVQAAMEYCAKFVQYLPPDAQAYDDASNNRALISGKSALIFNPPSAWAVARRDAPKVAADCWTFSAPMGPKGRYVPSAVFFWGVWQFSKNKTAAKELATYLMERPQVEERDNHVFGYDIPPFAGLLDFKVWETTEPPPGTVYNYPIRPWHHAKSSLTAFEANPDLAVQIYQSAMHNGMVARLKSGQSVKQVLAWANDQIQGFMH